MRHPVRDILGAGGPVARALGDGYEARPEQGEMAAAVSEALATKTRLVVEAGTGVGKSFAYLVPAMLRCLTSSERVVVATHTIALQEQLIRRDIPFLMEVLGDGAAWGLDPKTIRRLSPVLVKGRGNYVSLRRLSMAVQRQDRLLADAAQKRSLEVIQHWSLGTADGSLASLPPLERPGVWERVRSDADNCMGRKCPTYDTCHYQRSRREMEGGNLLVCNHAVFFADLSLRRQDAGFLPPYDHVVFDEAHTLEDVACEHFGLSLTESKVEFFLGGLHHAHSGKGYLPQLALLMDAQGKAELVDAAVHAVAECQAVSRAFFEELHELLRSGALRNGRLLRPEMLHTPLPDALRLLAGRLRHLKEAAPGDQDKFELNAFMTRAEATAEEAAALVAQSLPGCVYWAESGAEGEPDERAGRGRRLRLRLACSPIDVSPLLRQHLFGTELSVVLTSATLATGGGAGGAGSAGAGRGAGPTPAPPAPNETHAGPRFVPEEAEAPPVDQPAGRRAAGARPVARPAPGSAFAHLRLRLGVDDARELVLGSPFDHVAQSRLVVDLGVPNPRSSAGLVTEREAYARTLAGRVLHHLRATEGGAFVLFTSFDLLRRVAAHLEGPLAGLGWPMFVQGDDGPPATILAHFRKDDHSVLLGAASFWQGVDVKGRGLRNVIITRLPFDPPDRPLVEARGERLKAMGMDPFREDSLPRAILRFKQGYGRLIRSRTDTGRVVVLDPRISQLWYGRRFIEALPAGLRVEKIAAEPDGAAAGW